MEITFDDVKKELACGNRVLLMVRHAERYKIDHNDPTFGESLPLTEEGISTSIKFGENLKEFSDDVQFVASPLLRTVMTAQNIAKGMGLEGIDVETADLLGNGSFYFSDITRVYEEFRDGSFFEKIFAYFKNGTQCGFTPLLEATDSLENWLMEKFSSRLGVFTSHDLYIGAFLHARNVKTDFTFETWLRFLDAAAIIIERDGKRRYALLRAGLSDKCLGVRK